MVEKNKLVHTNEMVNSACSDQLDSDHIYYTKGKGYQQIRQEIMAEFVGLSQGILDLALHGDYSNGNEAQGLDEGQVLAHRALDDYQKEIDSLLQSPEPAKWLDRPNRAGKWWVSGINPNELLIIEVENTIELVLAIYESDEDDYYTIDDFINKHNKSSLVHSKWLHIEEPELLTDKEV